jgi:hypothetical protein
MTKASNPPGWTNDLTPEQLEELHVGMASGKGPSAMTKWFREKYPDLWKDLNDATMVTRFKFFKRTVVSPQTQRVLAESVVARRNVDTLAEIEDMIALHKRRVLARLQFDDVLKLVGIPDDAELAKLLHKYRSHRVDDEIERHIVMLERLAKLYLEVGILHRVPKKAELTLTDMMKGKKVLEWSEEDEAKVLSAGFIEGTFQDVSDEA